MLAAAFLAGALLAVAGAVPATNATAEPHSLVWPPPQSLIASGAPLPLSADFSITTTHSSATLDQAIAAVPKEMTYYNSKATVHSNVPGTSGVP